VCPLGLIDTESFVVGHEAIKHLFTSGLAQALEIHTQSGHEPYFRTLWQSIGIDVLKHASILAISFPENGTNTLSFLENLQTEISTSEEYDQFTGFQIFQTDGRPMSGDIGKGTARAACEMGNRLLTSATSNNAFSINNGQRQFVQLAGGTNDYSIVVAKEIGLIDKPGFGGFAFGGYARKKVGSILRDLEDEYPGAKIEDHPAALQTCLDFALSLVRPIKG
jgi:hypothetical protein